jgi:CMP-N-acetylneuraminic acid synthetase
MCITEPSPPAEHALARRTFAIVPARGGSKGITRKNIRLLAGKPLLEYTLIQARAAGLHDVVLSTEDAEIARIGRRLGFAVPFLRPTALAADDTPTLEVLLHALGALRDLGDPRAEREFVLLLQPTSPLRRAEWIERALHDLDRSDADAAMTVLPVPAEHNPHWVYRRSDEHPSELTLFTGETQPISRRQDLPPVYHREGSVYVVRRTVLETQRSLYGRRTLGIEVDPRQSINLDTLADWELAEQRLGAQDG